MEAALWAFLGALVGAAASIVTTWLNNTHAISRQRMADSLEREERARGFQRDNLLEVQEALETWIRFCARMLIEDQRAFGDCGE